MSRERAYSGGAYSTASSGYGSEDHHHYPSSANNTPRRKKKNSDNNPNHHNRYHDMTLLCHRVDLFDDFVPSSGKRPGENCFAGGLVPIRCLSVDRGCACRTPCTFCHTVVEDFHEATTDESASALPSVLGGGEALNPAVASLFSGNALTKKPCSSQANQKETEPKTTVISNLVVDPIFAQNHGLLSDHVEGGVKVKKYHHPPVARYMFTPPLMELSQFFDHTPDYTQNSGGHHETHYSNQNNAPAPVETKEDDSGLDSFFDDFAMKGKIEAPKPQPPPKKPKHTDNDANVLVFRAPLKTVVKKTITSDNSDWSGKCLCQCRYENLIKGSSQPNPHDPSVVHDKYWAQRRRLFKKFDEGIKLDAEGWYSVTPEVVADHVASRFADASDQLVRGGRIFGESNNNPNQNGGYNKKPPNSMVILDAFCGCGGNAIAFAKLPSSVVSLIVCIDVDREKLRNAAHNASIYRIPPNRIVFVEANSVAVMERCYRDGNLIMDPPPRTPEALSAYPPREVYDDFTIGGIDLLAEYAHHIDAVFMDPPWGGINYGAMGKDGYDLARDMKIRGCKRGCIGFPPTPEVDGVQLLKIAAAATSTRFVAYDLPRNANKRSLAHAALEAGYEGNSKLEEHYLNGRLKTVTGYFGQDFRHLLDLKKYHHGTDGSR